MRKENTRQGGRVAEAKATAEHRSDHAIPQQHHAPDLRRLRGVNLEQRGQIKWNFRADPDRARLITTATQECNHFVLSVRE